MTAIRFPSGRSLVFMGFLLLCSDTARSQGDFWTQTDGPPGGAVRCFAAGSSEGILIGTGGGGLYFSTDNGSTWTRRNQGLLYGRVNDLVIDSAGTLFAGTERSLFRSTDGGLDWELTSLSNNAVNSLLVDPGGRIFACVDNSVQVSTDHGNTWQYTANGLPSDYCYSLTIAPGGAMFLRNQAGVFRSTDGGANWATANNGLPSTSTSALCATPGGQLFVGIFLSGIYRSTDGGDTWGPANAGLGDLRVYGFGATATLLLAGTGGGIFRSTDGGGFWVASNSGFKNPYVGARCFLLRSDSLLLAGTDAVGVLRSTNGGSSWTTSNHGLNSCLVQSIAFSPAGRIVAGTWGGVFMSTDNGSSWVSRDSGITNTLINTVAVHPNGSLFAGSFPFTGTPLSCAFRSTDNGTSWAPVRNGWTYTFNNVLGFAFNSSGHVFAASNDYVYKSTNNGDSWVRSNAGLTNSLVYSIAINRVDQVFAGTYGSGMFRSTDAGASWTAINTGLTATEIMALVIDPNGTLFAGSNGSGVFRSSDNGENWTQVLGAGRFLQCWGLAADRDGHVFSGVVGGQYSDLGVWRSTDKGENWTQLNGGLYDSSPFVQALGVSPGGFAFAGTIGAGLYRSVNPTTGVVSPPTYALGFGLDQNYPNPFNPATTIRYSIPDGSSGNAERRIGGGLHVTLKVCDVMGREVATLVDGVKQPGSYAVVWNASGLSSGVYFCRLQAGRVLKTRKLVLLR